MEDAEPQEDHKAVFRIHRIHMFLGLPDPVPLIRGMDPDTAPDHQAKKLEILDSYCFVTSFGLTGSGSISQRHGCADPDPDPHQNVMDLEHCLAVSG
jgi:hypothetical protein